MEAAKSYLDFYSKFNISAFNEKANFFRLSLTVFWRLQIYKAIAAIFWQSSSYVFVMGFFA